METHIPNSSGICHVKYMLRKFSCNGKNHFPNLYRQNGAKGWHCGVQRWKILILQSSTTSMEPYAGTAALLRLGKELAFISLAPVWKRLQVLQYINWLSAAADVVYLYTICDLVKQVN